MRLPLAVQSFPLGDQSEVNPTSGEDVDVGRVSHMGFHVEVHATVAGVEVRDVPGEGDGLANIPVTGVVHLDRVDVVIVVAVATTRQLDGGRVVGRPLDAVHAAATGVGACHEHRVDLVVRQCLSVEGRRDLLGDGQEDGACRPSCHEDRGEDCSDGNHDEHGARLLASRAGGDGTIHRALRTCRCACFRDENIIV